MSKPIKKVREGLMELIDDLIENTKDLILNSNNEMVKDIIKERINRLERYISVAKIYDIPKLEIDNLRFKYNALKYMVS